MELKAVMAGAADDAGIPHGRLLAAFAEAAIAGAPAALEAARAALRAAAGTAALVDAAGIVGFFDGINRVADATGTPLDGWVAAETASMRSELGIDAIEDTRRALAP